MKRVLVLSYYFPPLGGAGVQRTVKLLKHLPALDYQAAIVAAPESAALDWAPRDDTLAEELPPSLVVRRVAGPQPPNAGGWEGRFRRWLARPSSFSRWWVEGAVSAARELAREADLVYASMSPFETAEAAARVAQEARLPWVADLRDPWALDDWTVYPTAVHQRVERRRMGKALASAAAVVVNTPEAERALSWHFPYLKGRLATVPNGWDEEDFAAPPPERHDDAFRIVHTGYAHRSASWRSSALRGLVGGAAKGVEHGARSHVYLLAALERLHSSGADHGRRIELHLAGPSAPAQDRYGLICDHGYLRHADAVALVRSADLLFLPMHDVAPDIRVRTVPGKTYEYLASGRPILAALPEGDARDLIAGLPHVRLCRPRAVTCMAEAVSAALAEPRPEPHVPEAALAFERRRLAARLVDVFDRVLAGSSAAGRRVGVGL